MKAFFYTLLLLLCNVASWSQTIITDNSNVSGTWTYANSPYIIEGRAIILAGQTLTIEPGVEIQFATSTSFYSNDFEYVYGKVGVLHVQGKLIANGTLDSTISFTRFGTTAYWACILFDEYADSNSSITNSIIEYANEISGVTGITSVVSFDAGISFYKSKAKIQYCEIRNCRNNGLNYFYAPDGSLSNNKIHDNGKNGIYAWLSNIRIENNYISHNSFLYTGYVSAIANIQCNNIISGNLIYENDDVGIFISDSTTKIYNNTILKNYQGIRIEKEGNFEIKNSIIYTNETDYATSGAYPSATIYTGNSLVGSSFPSNVIDSGGNIFNTFPQFTDTLNDDYSLLPSSVCIDAGDINYSNYFPLVDINGNTRITNGIIDMGAYEYLKNVVTNISETKKINYLLTQNHDIFTINLINQNDNIKNIRLYNLIGEKMYSIENIKSNEVTLNMNIFNDGIYFIEIRTENEIFVKKIYFNM